MPGAPRIPDDFNLSIVKMNIERPAGRATLPPPTREQIVARAHRLWIEAGRPEGHDREHWAEAERQLSGFKPARPADAGPAHPSP